MRTQTHKHTEGKKEAVDTEHEQEQIIWRLNVRRVMIVRRV